MNRIDRLSAILIQLQSRKTVRAQDIAERFEISLRTVYRDIRSLEEAGIPVIGEAGIGYSLVDGYRLPPVLFTREEATSFITAEKLVNQLTDATNGRIYTLAMDKIRAVLKTTDQAYLEQLEERVHVVKNDRTPDITAHQNFLQVILQALAQLQVMELKYFAYYRQEHTKRQIEPVGVFYLDNYWHLIAWCRERKAYRDFRFDRIVSIQACEEQFADQHPGLQEYLKNRYKDSSLIEVTLLVDPEASLHLGEQKYYQGYISEQRTDPGIEMKFITISLEGMARWYMSFADYAVVISPDSLKNRAKELFLAMAKNIENS